MMGDSKQEEEFVRFLCDGDDAAVEKIKEWCQSSPEREKSSVFEERLSAANAFVDSGNAQFKSGSLEEAVQHYLAAAVHADFDFGQQWEMTEEHKRQIRVVKIRVLLNMANSWIKGGKFELARKACSLGIVLCKANGDVATETVAKFMYRRGRSLVELGSFEEAAVDCRKALEILPNEAAIREVLNRATLAGKKAKEKSDNVWKGKNMFGDSSGAIPHVDLVLTDSKGKPIGGQKKQQQPPAPVETEDRGVLQFIRDILCCKRRHIRAD